MYADGAVLIVAPFAPGLSARPVMPARLREQCRSYFVRGVRFSSESSFAVAGGDETFTLLKESQFQSLMRVESASWDDYQLAVTRILWSGEAFRNR